MKMKLVKIVYDYLLVTDQIVARQHFRPIEDGDQADLIVDGDSTEASLITHYSTREWEDMLYKLRAHRPHVEVKKAVQELIVEH